MKSFTLGSVALVSLVAASALSVGCKKDDPPPPLPTAAPVTATAAPLELKPEDAGVTPPPDAGKKKPTGGGSAGGLSACCAALAQNSNSAPTPEMKAQMQQAAAMCSAFAAQGKDRSSVAGILLGVLRGAGLPASCK